MRNFIRATTLLSVLAFAASPAAAATQSEFYLSLLRRGVASYDASRYTDAAKQLRLAAFGLVDTIDQYQLAHMYLAMTLDKMGQKDRAADSARRVISAERVERKYGAAPAAVRASFETVAAKLLTPAEIAMLRGGPIVPATPPQTSSTTTTTRPATTTPPRTTTPAPIPAAQQPAVKPPATQPATQPRQDRAVVTPPQQTTRSETAAPQTSTTTVPAPAKPKPEPAAAKPAVKPPATTTPSTTTTSTPPRTAPATTPARPATTAPAATAPAPRPLTANEISARLATAERALAAANLTEARRAYRELLGAQGLDHDAMMRVAEGLYRARDFAGALTAFANLGALRRGEEPYRYYIAVAAFETGDRARAKRELAAALPYIEVTADVARYRTRIESAQ